MQVLFVVFSSRPEVDPLLEKAIKDNYPGSFYSMDRNRWLIAAEATAREVSDQLGITTDPATVPSSQVFAISGYYGRASSEMWDWMATKSGGKPSAK
jgi:hypothetical protein